MVVYSVMIFYMISGMTCSEIVFVSLCNFRDSMQIFEELSDIFSDQNNYLTSRELLMRVSSCARLSFSVLFSCTEAFKLAFPNN